MSVSPRRTAGKPVTVSLADAGPEVVLEIRDHGPGIAAEDVPRVFERFERASSTRHYGGLGLGLYLVREIVTAHGGSVSAGNAPGGGASFTVRLPRQTMTPARGRLVEEGGLQ